MIEAPWIIAVAALAVLAYVLWQHHRGRQIDEERLERDIHELKDWAEQRLDELEGRMVGLTALHREALDAFGEAAEHAGWRRRERDER